MRFLSYLIKSTPVLTVLVIIMGGCSLRVGEYSLFPALYLIPIYYWIIFCPSWIPLWSLFGLGLFYDSLMGYELGFSSVLLMLSSFLGQYVRPLLIPHNFLIIWGGFCLYSFGYIVLYSFLAQGKFFSPSWIYGISLYPLMAWGLSHFHLRLRLYA